MTRILSSIAVATLIFTIFPPGRGRAGELADRRGVPSHWKRSGRTYRALDYPYSPQLATYGGQWPREWGNRGFLFVAPIEEVPPWEVYPIEEIPPIPEEVVAREELLARLEREEARQKRMEELIERLEAELEAERARAEEEAVKRIMIEAQLEEMEELILDPDLIPPRPVDVELVPTRTDLYLVRPNDTLWTIAGRPEVYDDPYKWLLLYHANRDQIFHPDWIYPDMVLLVPRYPGLEEPGRERITEEPVLPEQD